MKGVLWKVAKRLSYIEDALCLKVKQFVGCFLVALQRIFGRAASACSVNEQNGFFISVPPISASFV